MNNLETGYIQRFRGLWPLGLVLLVMMAAVTLFVANRIQPASVVVPAPATMVPATITPPPVATMLPTPSIAQMAATQLLPEDLLDALLRTGIRPEGVFPSVDVVLADAVYFAVTQRELPTAVNQEPSLLFYISENSHDDLPEAAPAPLLKVDGEAVAEPVESMVLADSYHHRTTFVRYAGLDKAGIPLVTEATKSVELVFAAGDIGETSSNVLQWKLPIQYTEDILSREVILGLPEPASDAVEVVPVEAVVVGAVVVGAEPVVPATTATGGGRFMSWAAILAIMAGMLTVLSPCLIQLVVYYAAALTGVGTEGGQVGQSNIAAAQKHILQTGLFFALGFTAIYTAGGAAAGYIGQSLDRLGLLNTWMRPISIVAGIVIVIMALRVAWNPRAPLVCNLPMGRLFGHEHRTGLGASLVMGMSFAGGCMACFSATVLPALLLYAGSTGSVFYGALLLLVFSLGVTVPCLLLAFGISKVQPLMGRLQHAGPMLGLISAAVMAAFGVIMITDQFHVLSGYVYQLMGLS